MTTERYTFFVDYSNHLVLAKDISVLKDKGRQRSLLYIPVSSTIDTQSTFTLTKKELADVLCGLKVLLDQVHLYYATVNEDSTIKQLFVTTWTEGLLDEI